MASAFVLIAALVGQISGQTQTSTAHPDLDAGTAALWEFRLDDAIAALERARAGGPYGLEAHIRLYEQLGIAYAYAERKDDAISAFTRLLELNPGHAIDYSLSPKATLPFADARKIADSQRHTAIELRWPRERKTSDALPIDIDIYPGAQNTLHEIWLFAGLAGQPSTPTAIPVEPGLRNYRHVIPALARSSTTSKVLQLYLVARDRRGNDVYRWASATEPREIELTFVAPEPWYEKWWVWTIVGTVAAASTGAAVYAATREPGPTISGSAGLN